MSPTTHTPRKRFGQHFLHDPAVIARIVDAVNPVAEKTVVEIGPGRGALTFPLLRRGGRLHAVELDRDLIESLRAGARPLGELILHQADALMFDFSQIAERPLTLCGNLPYNIATPLLFRLFTLGDGIRRMTFMVQKEVAQRLAARPGEEGYGRLSVTTQSYCRVDSLFDVRPGAFLPPPQVDSSVVDLTPVAHPEIVDRQLFEQLVKKAFAQRRKTLRNNLKGVFDGADFAALEIDPQTRPERIDLDGYVQMANRLAAAK